MLAETGSSNHVITLIAVAIFAVTGVLAGLRNGSNIFGLLVFGLITALGGGTIRDIVLNIPVFWVEALSFIWVAAGAAIITFLVHPVVSRAYRLLLYLDAVGVALFAIQATDKVLGLGYAPPIAVIMGVITGIGGGLVRDLLTGRPTLLATRELYATPILLGIVLYLSLLALAPEFDYSWLAAMVFIFGFRAVAVYWDLSMPGWLTVKMEV